MKSCYLTISGYVQGIGFRQFVKSNAKRLGICGWVRNTEKGGVEALLQGKQEAVQTLIALCEKGPMLAEVKDVAVSWTESKPCASLKIIL